MPVIFTNRTKRIAVLKLTGGYEIMLSRSKADGSTVGIRLPGYGSWKTLDVVELLDALSYVTKSDEELLAAGLPEDQVKPQVKRVRKKKIEHDDDDDWNPFDL